MLIAASALFGLSIRSTALSRIQTLEGVLALVRHIRRKISLFEAPMHEILHDFPPDLLPKLSEKLSNLPFEDAMAVLYADLGESAHFMRDFAEKIVKGYKNETLSLCDDTICVLEETVKKQKQEFVLRKRMYIILPVLLMLSVIILLI